jgi:hypothetical protein
MKKYLFLAIHIVLICCTLLPFQYASAKEVELMTPKQECHSIADARIGKWTYDHWLSSLGNPLSKSYGDTIYVVTWLIYPKDRISDHSYLEFIATFDKETNIFLRYAFRDHEN